MAAIYLVGRLSFRPRAGLAAAAMLAISPVAIDYSQEARAYSLLVLLVLLSATGLIWWLKGLRFGRTNLLALILFAFATVLAFYTHFTSVFWILPAVVGGREITDRLGGLSARRDYVITCIGMVIAAAPEMARIVFQLFPRAGLSGLGFVPDASFADLLLIASNTVLPRALQTDSMAATGWALAVLFSLIILYAVGRLTISWGQARLWVRRNPAVALTIGSLAALPLSVWLFSEAISPIFMPRSIVLGIPGMILLLVCLSEFDRVPYGLLYVAASAAALVAGGLVREKEPWKVVATRLDAGLQRGDGILICRDWRAPALLHSAPNLLKHPVYLVQRSNLLWLKPYKHLEDWDQELRRPLTWWVGSTAPIAKPAKRSAASNRLPARVWIVESDCSKDQTRLVRLRLGRGIEQQVLKLAETPHHSAISLSLFSREHDHGDSSAAVGRSS